MSISFEEAIVRTTELLEGTDVSPEQMGEAVQELLMTENGARGFFVTFLTGDWYQADQPSPQIMQALAQSPTPTAELLVKNLVMSTAMAITHRRNGDLDMANSSVRVQRRCRYLLQHLHHPDITPILQKMLTGEYEAFYQKWGYDEEQRQAIAQELQSCLQPPV
ncbi:MAG: hypothetical protein RMK91_10065 [Pseudanabaenaceae cyanobacterium SKYGB_i_bin29]|nr:hypothetical protein [Pseudanabaenaceae cyanobacterium SKYG29]MDW8422197.1 hypothetical protein [Pseudanabaenaceae cyanobacterium SKYGB_i_bin29]